MKDKWWQDYGGDMAMFGVQALYNECKQGPQYAIGVVGTLPFEIIPMEAGGFDIMREF